MPRTGQRSLRSEELRVAARVAWELREREMTYAAFAERLTEARHPTHASAIFKLIHGTPRRRLSLNEAAAIADVLGVTLQELLVEQDVLLSREANGLLRELQEAGRALQEPLSRYRETLSRISAFVEDGDRMDEGAQAAVADVQSALSGVERYYEDAVNRIYGMADFLAGKYDPPPS